MIEFDHISIAIECRSVIRINGEIIIANSIKYASPKKSLTEIASPANARIAIPVAIIPIMAYIFISVTIPPNGIGSFERDLT